MLTYTKKQLIHRIAQKLSIHHSDVRNVIQTFLDEMIETLAQGHRLEFRDFGVFEVVQRKEKIGRNPKNATVPIIIPPRKAVKFISGKKMKQQIEALEIDINDRGIRSTQKADLDDNDDDYLENSN